MPNLEWAHSLKTFPLSTEEDNGNTMRLCSFNQLTHGFDAIHTSPPFPLFPLAFAVLFAPDQLEQTKEHICQKKQPA